MNNHQDTRSTGDLTRDFPSVEWLLSPAPPSRPSFHFAKVKSYVSITRDEGAATKHIGEQTGMCQGGQTEGFKIRKSSAQRIVRQTIAILPQMWNLKSSEAFNWSGTEGVRKQAELVSIARSPSCTFSNCLPRPFVSTFPSSIKCITRCITR